jgi:hypothetical protein
MNNPRLWFDQGEFARLTEEYGQSIDLCKRTVVVQVQTDYGIPEKRDFQCRRLVGYAIADRKSVIVTNAGNVNREDWRAYIQPIDFSPEDVDENTFLRVNGTYYQMELVQAHLQRGQPLQYEYRLQRRTEDTTLKDF